MKVLIISFYYFPDLCAGSFRASSIVEALQKKMGNGQIEVITTMPNRYKTYKVEAPRFEEKNNTIIKRIPIPSHKSGMVDQAWAFKSFAWGAIKEVRGKEYDLVFATTSRLMTGLLGFFIAKKIKKTKLYIDIRDIFTDTMEDILKSKIWSPAIKFLKYLEKRMVLKADKVNLISPGFLEYFEKIAPEKDFSFFTNGIDEEFLNFDFKQKNELLDKSKPIILYAGNIGDGQGLHRIIPKAAKKLEDSYDFIVIGDGGTRFELEKKLEENDVKNVKLIPPMNRSELVKYYSETDILLVHLNEYKAFEKVIPSKLFEYGSTGKPILAGVGGYAKEFVEKNIPNAMVFKPCDANDFVAKLSDLKLGVKERSYFKSKFATTKITDKMTGEIIENIRGKT